MPSILSHTRITAGDSEPERWLLVLHGIYGTGRNWASLARRLVETRPEWGVLLVDLRLHGGSRDFPPPHTLRSTVADVDALVRHLDFHAAAVLGHSFGGKVALLYARHHPEGLRQAWVIDSTLAVREPSGSAWRIVEIVRTLPDRFATREELVEALVPHGYARPIGQWLAMNLERDGDAFRWRLDWPGVEALLRDYFRTDLWDVVESPPGAVDVHVVKATESDALDSDDVARIETASGRGGRTAFHTVEGGHWINVDNPAGMEALLERHLP